MRLGRAACLATTAAALLGGNADGHACGFLLFGLKKTLQILNEFAGTVCQLVN